MKQRRHPRPEDWDDAEMDDEPDGPPEPPDPPIGQPIRPFKRWYGAIVPDWLMERKSTEISQGAKLAYGKLAQRAGKNGKAFPSEAKLAEDLGVSKSKVKRYLVELRDSGLIRYKQRGLNQSNDYEFLSHEWQRGRTRAEEGEEKEDSE